MASLGLKSQQNGAQTLQIYYKQGPLWAGARPGHLIAQSGRTGCAVAGGHTVGISAVHWQYTTQHRVTETTEDSQTTNKNAHCRLGFAKRNRDSHINSSLLTAIQEAVVFSLTVWTVPLPYPNQVQIASLKWHFFHHTKGPYAHNFGKNKKLSCKKKIQLKNFVLKGNFKLFFFKFPEDMVCMILKTTVVCSSLSITCLKNIRLKKQLLRLQVSHPCVVQDAGGDLGFLISPAGLAGVWGIADTC